MPKENACHRASPEEWREPQRDNRQFDTSLSPKLTYRQMSGIIVPVA